MATTGDSDVSAKQYPKTAFLAAIEDSENATTKKVAAEVGCSQGCAYRRLKTLSEDGEITRIEIGSSFVWTI